MQLYKLGLIYYNNKIRLITILKNKKSISGRKKYVYAFDHSDSDKIKLFKINKLSYL